MFGRILLQTTLKQLEEHILQRAVPAVFLLALQTNIISRVNPAPTIIIAIVKTSYKWRTQLLTSHGLISYFVFVSVFVYVFVNIE